jgi:hypothetical protein
VEPTRLQKERKVKEQLAEKRVSRNWKKRSWRELRAIARDRRKWKELVENLCSWWNDGHYYYYYFTLALNSVRQFWKLLAFMSLLGTSVLRLPYN